MWMMCVPFSLKEVNIFGMGNSPIRPFHLTKLMCLDGLCTDVDVHAIMHPYRGLRVRTVAKTISPIIQNLVVMLLSCSVPTSKIIEEHLQIFISLATMQRFGFPVRPEFEMSPTDLYRITSYAGFKTLQSLEKDLSNSALAGAPFNDLIGLCVTLSMIIYAVVCTETSGPLGSFESLTKPPPGAKRLDRTPRVGFHDIRAARCQLLRILGHHMYRIAERLSIGEAVSVDDDLVERGECSWHLVYTHAFFLYEGVHMSSIRDFKPYYPSNVTTRKYDSVHSIQPSSGISSANEHNVHNSSQTSMAESRNHGDSWQVNAKNNGGSGADFVEAPQHPHAEDSKGLHTSPCSGTGNMSAMPPGLEVPPPNGISMSPNITSKFSSSPLIWDPSVNPPTDETSCRLCGISATPWEAWSQIDLCTLCSPGFS